MKNWTWSRIVSVAIFVLAFARPGCAQSPVDVTLDWKGTRTPIPESFSGLSFEAQLLLPVDGKYYFSANNPALVATFKTLGIKSIRVGGNTADNPEVKIPRGQDIDQLFAFAKAADAKVIYTLRLKGQNDPADDASIIKYIMDRYSSQVSYFAIGNEPNVYLKEYPAYLAQLTKFIDAIRAVAPDAKFCGPSSTPGKAAWARDLAKDLGSIGKLQFITQHSYPGGSAKKVTDPAVGRATMLSPEWQASYQKFFDTFVPAAQANGMQYRLEETNSFFNGGAKDVSDTMASALWAVDYMYWWAAHQAAGLNFHTGDKVAANQSMAVCRYAVYVSDSQGFNVHPVGYAMKVFDLARRGQLVPVKLASKDALNLSAYAVSSEGKNVFVTITNKENGKSPRDATVTIDAGLPYAQMQTISLVAPSNDISATSGLTLGGSPVGGNGEWDGKWTDTSAASDNGQFTVTVPAGSVIVVKLSAK